jgi:hypothetical protein
MIKFYQHRITSNVHFCRNNEMEKKVAEERFNILSTVCLRCVNARVYTGSDEVCVCVCVCVWARARALQMT